MSGWIFVVMGVLQLALGFCLGVAWCAGRSLAISRRQAWFWTEAWQAGEREADEDIAAGRVTTYDSTDDFTDALRETDDE